MSKMAVTVQAHAVITYDDGSTMEVVTEHLNLLDPEAHVTLGTELESRDDERLRLGFVPKVFVEPEYFTLDIKARAADQRGDGLLYTVYISDAKEAA